MAARWGERVFGDAGDDIAWRSMARTAGITLAAGFAAVAGAVFLVDPYDVVPFSPPAARPPMDLNQRWLYPAIVRSGRYDSLVVGTSTIRLLDPDALESVFGGSFAALAMNSATAWEQVQVARLFMREEGPPRTLIVGIDSVWCDRRADQNRITFRGFPEWMYDDNRWNDLLHLLNGKTVEISGRLVAYWLGLREERYRQDGYEVFVPAESEYDLARARGHLYPGVANPPPPPTPPAAPFPLSQEQKRALRFPAHDWLEALMAETKGRTRVVLAAMPVHVAATPPQGTEHAAIEAVCLDRLAELAQRHGALMVDWRFPSPLTRDDSNYWDPLHYRLPVAARIVSDLKAAAAGSRSADGTWKVRARP